VATKLHRGHSRQHRRRGGPPKLIDKLQDASGGAVGSGFLAGITMLANSSVGGAGGSGILTAAETVTIVENARYEDSDMLLLETLCRSSAFSSVSGTSEL